MMRGTGIRWALGFVAIGTLHGVGCAREPEADDEGAVAALSQALAESPLGKPASCGLVEYRAPTTWTTTAQDGFEMLTSPDSRAHILLAPLKASDTLAGKRDAALAVFGATEVRLAEERSIRVGEGQLEAKASDGACRIAMGEAGFQYAVVDAGREEKTFVFYLFEKSAPESTRTEGMRMIASFRAKF
ncbi:hypothetical protein [Polyangium jinanense]|uniref:Lipoprotein n=1 Tax=Polyangium jinanense TaxID=2829994 RepID=A0A9X3X6Z8_9BACT|nr:hypothetical protein [Polyangium jinanense]MDC3956764.1 hypothetical protein [Polyangium jinanense]MDC3984827.1 hypothetical protein [Polyangium jinanense]